MTAKPNYMMLDQSELQQLVDEYMALARAASTSRERNLWRHKAKRVRAYLPAKKCDAPGCTNMCHSEFCCKACAGATRGVSSPYHPIHGQVDALFETPVWQSSIYNPMEARVTG